MGQEKITQGLPFGCERQIGEKEMRGVTNLRAKIP